MAVSAPASTTSDDPFPPNTESQIARFTELRGRQPGDLQHLESQTHCTNP